MVVVEEEDPEAEDEPDEEVLAPVLVLWVVLDGVVVVVGVVVAAGVVAVVVVVAGVVLASVLGALTATLSPEDAGSAISSAFLTDAWMCSSRSAWISRCRWRLRFRRRFDLFGEVRFGGQESRPRLFERDFGAGRIEGREQLPLFDVLPLLDVDVGHDTRGREADIQRARAGYGARDGDR